MSSIELPGLNRVLLEERLIGTERANYPKELLDYPERIIQFGEGNFLRAFVEWMIHEMNKAGVFKGRVVVVQPISQGRVEALNAQDGLYTLMLRGRQDGEVINKQEIIPAISRGLTVDDQWDEILRCAEDPRIEFVISNTTEAGIAYNPGEKLTDTPPKSFPGKLAAYLYHRYQYFKGDPSKGMVILPCELIDRNGDNLKQIILRLAAEWGAPSDFTDWLNQHNHFLNTLVDRIVTGYPGKEVAALERELGYRDQNLDTGEIFHLWVIEGDLALKERLPFHKANLNVKWVHDLTPYRTRKVRILNGAHTSTVAAAYLGNLDLVRDAVNDEVIGRFMREAIYHEIIPVLPLERAELEEFAAAVLERFNNPFIEHRWLDIALNSVSKFTARVLPSLTEYLHLRGDLPKRLTFSVAALIALYRGTEIREGKLVCCRNKQEYFMQDDLEALQFFEKVWSGYKEGALGLTDLTQKVLERFWPEETREIPELTTQVGVYLQEILKGDIRGTIERLF